MYNFRQERFSKVFEKTYDDFIDEDLENGLYHVKDEFYFDVLIRNFSSNFLNSNKIIICFSGAITDRKEKIAPFFSGENIAAALRVPLIAFSDPQVSASELNLAWYMGGKANATYPRKVLSFLKNVSKKYQKEFIFFGGAGGGYAALFYATALGIPASCLVWNAQIKIENYVDVFVDKYINVAFENENKYFSRLDRESFFKDKKIYHDISILKENKNLKIIYLQNINDTFHINHHLKFFMADKRWKRIDNDTVVHHNTVIHYGNWGEGHAMPQKHIIQNILDKMINNYDLLECIKNNDLLVDRTIYKYDKLELNVVDFRLAPVINFEESQLKVNIRLFDQVGQVESNSIKYACYLLCENVVIQKKMYQNLSDFNFIINISSKNEFSIRCFVLDTNQRCVMNTFIVPERIYRVD